MTRSPAQWFCLVGGAILLVRGGIGLALDPAFETPGEGWHQLIHLLSGAALLAVAGRAQAALALTLGFGAIYAVFAVVGIADGRDIFGLIEVETGDKTIHVLLTAAALLAAMASLRVRAAPPAGTG